MQKLLEVQKKLLTYNKNGNNPHFNSKYLTLDNLLDKLLPVCNDLGLLVFHNMKENMVTTSVVDDKEIVSSSFPITDFSNPQKIGSAITYAKRYNLSMIFNIVTDDDDDGAKASQPTKLENHNPIPPVQRKKFLEENYNKFENEYKKHIGRYPTADSILNMLDTQYIVSNEYRKKIVDFYAKL